MSTGYNEAPHDFQIQPLEIFLVLPALCGEARDKGEEIEKLPMLKHIMANQLLGQKTILIWLAGGGWGGLLLLKPQIRQLRLIISHRGGGGNWTINHHSPIVQRVWR